MWLSDAQSTVKYDDMSQQMLKIPLEIGVALTTFGGLFMLLGVMLFFDGALLALGNVRITSLTPNDS